jgi:hypothetical protein
MYYITFVGRVIRDYFIEKIQSPNLSDVQMQDICQIRIKLGHKPDMCLHMAALQFYGDRQNKH